MRTRPVVPAAFAYSERKYHEFHTGRMTWRTVSRMPVSVTEKSPPRRIGEDIRYQRMASAPWVSNTFMGSG